MTKEFVQFGCGWSAPQEWRNFDASPTLRFERLPLVGRFYTKNATRFPANVEYGDIVKGLPVTDGACSAVYCSHVLEHLSLEDMRTAIRNCFKLLKPGGIFRLVVPDLQYAAKKYLSMDSADAAPLFMRETYLGVESRPRGLSGLMRTWLGNSRHLWMWDYTSLKHELVNAGFVEVRRARFGDSGREIFTSVEAEDRWADALGIECRRPG